MSEEMSGDYLLLVDRGYDGWTIECYKTWEALLAAVRSGRTFGQGFVIAKELKLGEEEDK